MQMVSKGVKVAIQESQHNCDAIRGFIIVSAEFDYVQFNSRGDSADVLTMILMDPVTHKTCAIKVGEHVHEFAESLHSVLNRHQA